MEYYRGIRYSVEVALSVYLALMHERATGRIQKKIDHDCESA